MSKRYPRARWTLPTTVNPSTSTGWCVPVPDDPFHKAAFLGALATLGSAWSWADDPSQPAKEVADVWRNIIDNLEPCPMLSDVRIRLNPTDFCTIQLSTDAGANWADVADLSDCANAAANSIIDGRISDGSLSGGLQPGGNNGVISAQCYDYDVTLQGNGRWISPIPVQDGDTIQVTNVKGAWFDGVFSGIWKCADGHTFALGACLGGGQGTAGADPAPTLYHMNLIGQFGTSPAFFDAYNQAFTIPGGTPLSDLIFQANDSDLTDNQGSVTFHVQICKNHWVVDFDLAAAPGPWYVHVSGKYVAGQGWTGNGAGNHEQCYIVFTILHNCVLTEASFDFDVTAAHQGYQGAGIGYNNAVSLASNNALAETPGGTLAFSGSYSMTAGDFMGVSVNVSSSPLGSIRIYHAHLEGSGANPFVP